MQAPSYRPPLTPRMAQAGRWSHFFPLFFFFHRYTRQRNVAPKRAVLTLAGAQNAPDSFVEGGRKRIKRAAETSSHRLSFALHTHALSGPSTRRDGRRRVCVCVCASRRLCGKSAVHLRACLRCVSVSHLSSRWSETREHLPLVPRERARKILLRLHHSCSCCAAVLCLRSPTLLLPSLLCLTSQRRRDQGSIKGKSQIQRAPAHVDSTNLRAACDVRL